MSNETKSWLLFLSRFFMGTMFIVTGVRKSIGLLGGGGFPGSSKFVASQMGVGIDTAQILLGLAVALEIIAGLMLVLGYRTKLAAIGLIIFVLILTPIFHGPWLYELPRKLNELDQVMKNLNLVGCMLLYIAFGAGRISLDAKAGRAPRLA
jgi:putative oxidoreductase